MWPHPQRHGSAGKDEGAQGGRHRRDSAADDRAELRIVRRTDVLEHAQFRGRVLSVAMIGLLVTGPLIWLRRRLQLRSRRLPQVVPAE